MVVAKSLVREEYVPNATKEELVIYWGNLKGTDLEYLEVYRDFKPKFSQK